MSELGIPASRLLAGHETELLRRALLEWGGPARCGDRFASGMGFASEQDLLDQCSRLRGELANDLPISPEGWARILLAAEIVFISDLVGSGAEWSTTTGFSDEATVGGIRSIQRKLSRTIRGYYGRTPID
ncbi:hypothetical protein ACFO4E_07225 [Nocardiopsis mangrovi]|uniref:Uncharacterized protein n=1 Tax=Nocardiopsis mangrovi TaxID=1179818 RepID=A0ABV9DVL9_9ACTN